MDPSLRDKGPFYSLLKKSQKRQRFLIQQPEKIYFRQQLKKDMDGVVIKNLFNKVVDNLGRLVGLDKNQQLLLDAKYAIIIEQTLPQVGVDSINTVLCNRLMDSKLKFIERMTLLCLMHLIMKVETTDEFETKGQRPFCKAFESGLANSETEIFRKIVNETGDVDQGKQLYSLRQKWTSFFSRKVLREIDRDSIWGRITNASSYKKIQDLLNDRSSATTMQDKLIIFHETFAGLLNDDWIAQFPINESDKKRFTDKYSVKKPSEKEHVVSLYNKKIEFSPNKIKEAIDVLDPLAETDEYIEIAKEAFFVENIFGKNKTSVIAKIIMKTRMDTRKAETEEAFLRLLKTIVLVHIIVYAEATRSSYKNVPKIRRPFMNAFATDAFILKLKAIVASKHVNQVVKQNLYWMRLKWNICFEDYFLSKIEEEKWDGIKRKARADFKTKNKTSAIEHEKGSSDEISIIAQIDKCKSPVEVAVVLLEFSEDEEDDNDIQKQKSFEAEENYINTFMANRRNGWTKYFFMEPNCIEKLHQKFNFSGKPKINAKGKTITALDFAEKIFSVTFCETFPCPNESAFMNLAKEAFFLVTEFGHEIVKKIVKFLLPIMQRGLRYSTSPETKLVAQLIAFLTIHIITAIESVEPMIVPEIMERAYIKSIEENNGFLNVKSFIRTIADARLKNTLKFLTLTWTINDESRVSERTNVKYKRNQNSEIFLIRDIISNIKEKYKKDPATFEKEKLANKKRCRKILEEIEDDKNFIDVNRKALRKEKLQKKKEKKTEELLAKTAKNLQSLFVPDEMSTSVIPSVPKKRRIILEELSDDDESRRRSVPGNNRTSSSSTTSGLLGVNEQPIHQPRSKREKAMEDLKKLLDERNGRNKKVRPVSNEQQRPVTQVQMINNFDSDEFVNNLLTSSNFEIAFDDGAKVTFSHTT